MFTSKEIKPEYKILRPIRSNPRPHTIFEHGATAKQWQSILSKLGRGIVALDFETTGLDPFTDEIVGIGLSSKHYTCYVHVAGSTHVPWDQIAQLSLIAHNVMFDGRWLALKVSPGVKVNWQGDTYGMFKHLASEGFTNQSWGLKDAQISLLNWDAKGDVELDHWLITNGHTKGNTKDKADKGKMHLAPAKILGKYCALDADSTWQLWEKVFMPTCRQYGAYLRYHREEYVTLLHLLIEQQNRGMLLDMDHMEEYRKRLTTEAQSLNSSFLRHPDIEEHIRYFKMKAVEKKWYRKKPEVYTKSGKLSKNYLNWVENISTLYRETTINPDSSKQLRELYYGRIYRYEITKDRRGDMIYTVDLGNGRSVQLDGTKSGAAPTDGDALKWFGETGKILNQYKDTVKQLSFVDKYLELQRNSVLHPGWRVPGTLTGRLSGANPNLQQLAKTEDMLDIFRARPGYKLVGADFAALENVVLAELSRDENLLKLYGPNVADAYSVEYLVRLLQERNIKYTIEGDEIVIEDL